MDLRSHPLPVNASYIPFATLVIVALGHCWYFLTEHSLNNDGRHYVEWPLLIDALITLPLVCFLCSRKRPKDALFKAVSCAFLLVFLGSYIIPDNEKMVWLFLEPFRFIVLGVFVVFELGVIYCVIQSIASGLREQVDIDSAIAKSFERITLPIKLKQLLSIDSRMWAFLIAHNKIRNTPIAGSHYFCDLKDGARSNQLGFIIILLFELPVVHLLLHFWFSSTVAWVVTLLTIMGLLFFVAEYRALACRPISVTEDKLIIRYGLWEPIAIDYNDIESACLNEKPVKRSKNIKRFNLAGIPNVAIHLKLTAKNQTDPIRAIYLGVNQPQNLIAAIRTQADLPKI